MTDSHVRAVPENDAAYVEPGGTIDDAIRTLRRYVKVIAFWTIAVALLYTIGALAYYLLMPATAATSVTFRLDWEGAEQGRYPNGLRFSPADIVAKPVVLEVYERNELKRFATFNDFAQSLFVLESNRVADKLAAEYQTKLADPKLTPIERDRLETEYRSKRDATAKNEYALNHLSTQKTRQIPKTVLTKSLQDILLTWARFAAVERKVTRYPVAVMTPGDFDADATVTDPVVALQMLRTKVLRALDNIADLQRLPGADLVRTSNQRSFLEIRHRLEDVLRFHIEPMLLATRPADSAAAIRFAEAQLSYDERTLHALEDEATTARNSMIAYFNDPSLTRHKKANGAVTSDPQQQPDAETETLTPQLTDSFLDRLVALTKNPGDVAYRQRLVDEMRRTSLAMIPAQSAVDFDRSALEHLRSGRGTADPASARTEVTRLFADTRALVVDLNTLYTALSRNLEPAGQLYTLTAPPVRFRERSVAGDRLALYGLLTVLLAFPLILGGCLIYDRVRREFSAGMDEDTAAAQA